MYNTQNRLVSDVRSLNIPGKSLYQVMWDLWWTKQHCARNRSTGCSTVIIIIHHPGLLQ
jgi:hypothetical protein